MKIPVRVYEQLHGYIDALRLEVINAKGQPTDKIARIEWIDNNGINTPYLVTII